MGVVVKKPRSLAKGPPLRETTPFDLFSTFHVFCFGLWRELGGRHAFVPKKFPTLDSLLSPQPWAPTQTSRRTTPLLPAGVLKGLCTRNVFYGGTFYFWSRAKDLSVCQPNPRVVQWGYDTHVPPPSWSFRMGNTQATQGDLPLSQFPRAPFLFPPHGAVFPPAWLMSQGPPAGPIALIIKGWGPV